MRARRLCWWVAALFLGGLSAYRFVILRPERTGPRNATDIVAPGSESADPTGIADKGAAAASFQPPIILSQPETIAVFVGESVTFRIHAAGTAPLAYAWQFDGADLPNETVATLSLTNVQPTSAGDYQAIVSNSAGSITSQVATLIVDRSPIHLITTFEESALREAIARGGKVVFAGDGKITIKDTIDVARSVELHGGRHNVTISGSSDAVAPMFKVWSSTTMTISNVALVNGTSSPPPPMEAGGGAIFNDGGNIRVISCLLSNNAAVGYSGTSQGFAARGGAIYSEGGTIWLDRVFAIRNRAWGGSHFNGGNGGTGLGGAVYCRNGSIFVNNSTFVANNARGATSAAGAGGALGTENVLLVVSNSVFHTNTVIAGSAFFSLSPFAASPAFAGGAWLSGTTALWRCEFTANATTGGEGHPNAGGGAVAAGGAIYNLGTLDVRDTKFSANIATGGSSGGGGFGGQASGGGIFNSNTVHLNDSTFEQNVARGGISNADFPGVGGGGGALANAGTLFSTNCTFALNRTQTPAPAGSAAGGAIYNSGTLYLMNVTVASNTVVNASAPANLRNYYLATLTLRNSIVAYATGISNNAPVPTANAEGPITDGGFNISSDASCNFNSGSSFNSTDPRLGPLTDNGGPTPTMRLLANSPAINSGTPAGAPSFDQRGARRPFGGGVDIGAFELGPPAPILMIQQNGSMLDVSFLAEAGVSYELRDSTNLIAWQLQDTITAAATNRKISRAMSISGPRRFFRVQ
jgi:hypothetical protein